MSDIRVAGENCIDVSGESGALVFVDGVRGVGGMALDCDATSSAGSDTGLRPMGYRWFTASGHALLRGRGIAEAGNELVESCVSCVGSRSKRRLPTST